MKTIKAALVGLMIIGLGAGTVNAQDKGTTTTATKKQGATTDKKKPAPAATSDKTKKASSTSGQHLKKDGTPDMRYKENKAAAGDKKSDTKTTPAKGGSQKPTKAVKQAGTSGTAKQ